MAIAQVGRALATAKGLRAGTVWVNCYLVVDPTAPFGGYKESGHGRELGEKSLDNYLETKNTVIPMDVLAKI